MSIHQQIMQQITQCKRGEILFPTDFRGIGSDTAVKMSLSRIAAKGDLRRLSHGIYIKPKKSTGKTMEPSGDEIVAAIAERENIRVKACGDLALYQLGLIASEPKQWTYVTDGEPRQISYNDINIVFKSTTPKKLSMKGKISSLVIQVLEDCGKTNVTELFERQIREKLQKEDGQKLADDLKKAPAWVYQLLFQQAQKITSSYEQHKH
jgi:hypothetical protein